MRFEILSALNQPFDDLTAALPHERWKIHKAGSDYLGDCHELGVGFIANKRRLITSLFLYAEGFEGRRQFTGKLPEDLTVAMSRGETREKLGQPDSTSVKENPWDLYHREGYSLSVQYTSRAESIQLVALMTPETVPEM